MKKFISVLIFLVFMSSIIGCNKTSTTNVESKDSFKLQVENDKFKFYSFDKDKKSINDLSKILDENYKRITDDLKVSIKEKIEVEIYPDIQEFHNAINEPNAPNWCVGTARGKKIKMVSPLKPGECHTYDSLMQVIVHEFTHIVESNINSNSSSIPIWLDEGTAVYEARQMSNNIKESLKEKLGKGEIPSITEMNNKNFSERGGYVVSDIAIEYIVKNYGYDTLISLIKTPDNIESLLGMKRSEFESKWKAYLKENYA